MNFRAMKTKGNEIVNRIVLLLIFFLVFVAAAPASLPAQEQPDEGSDWRYSIATYMWALSMKGDVTVKGNKSDVDIPFSDVLDELNIGGMVKFEASKDRFGFFADVMYSHLGKETTVDGIKIKPTTQSLWAGVGGFYRLGIWDLAGVPDDYSRTVTLDTYLGVRYTHLDMELDFKNVPLPTAKGDHDWFEPMIGLRTNWNLSDRWSLAVLGDIGGMAFGSDFGWSAQGMLGYRFKLFGNDEARVFAGYRALSQDYDDGHGSNKFEWDVTLHGPVIGLHIPFGGKKVKAAEPPKKAMITSDK
jgi:hypothetical protein